MPKIIFQIMQFKNTRNKKKCTVDPFNIGVPQEMFCSTCIILSTDSIYLMNLIGHFGCIGSWRNLLCKINPQVAESSNGKSEIKFYVRRFLESKNLTL